jgi:hypothetical protein
MIMVLPVPPGTPVTCPYGEKGSSWATGEHGGIDYGAGRGTPVYAPWGGTITGASWGSAYGTHVVIDFDKLPDGSPGLWGVIAHLDTRVKNSGRIEAGEKIGTMGDSGNAQGVHTHFEIQPQSHWVQGSYRNPQPWINAGGGTTPPPSGDPWASGDVYQAKLIPGQMDSDSVRRLQRVLNEWSFVGGQELPVSGFYGPDTEHEVGLFQSQVCGDPADGAIGPKQTDVLFEKLGPWRIIR